MGIEQAYPVIAEHMVLHLTPREGCLRDISLIPSAQRDHTRLLNPVSTELLSRCNGQTPLGMILTELAARYTGDGFDIVAACREHLADLMQDNVLDIYWKPVDGRSRITGSRDYESPSHFMIELTDRCNLRCAHCYRNSSPECSQYIPTHKLLNIIDQMKENGISTIELTGGEPTLRPDFLQIFEHCTNRFATVALITNGWFIDNNLARFIGKKEHVIVQIDLDGAYAAAHDRLRGKPGAFLRALNAACAMKRHNVRFRIAMNVYAGNFDSIADTAMLAREVGASWFSFSPVVDLGRGRSADIIHFDQMAQLGRIANELEAEYGKDFIRGADEQLLQRSKEEGNCGAGWRSLVLGPNGHVRPCVMVDPDSMSMGNLIDTEYKDFLKAFNGSFFRHLKAPGPEYCSDCPHLKYCMGCFARTHRAIEALEKTFPASRCTWREQTGYPPGPATC